MARSSPLSAKLTLDTLLEELIAIPSPSGNEAAVLEYCESFLQGCGCETQRQWINQNQYNLLATRGESPSLLLYAHVDTVPPTEAWKTDPYYLEQEGDHLIGLGTSDMKAGVAILLNAAQKTNAPLKIALTVEEERNSEGAWALVKLPWFEGVQCILVPELSIDAAHETMGIGRRGLFTFKIETQGQAQHGSIKQGLNPIDSIAEVTLALRDYPLDSHPQWGDESLLIFGAQSQAKGLSVPEKASIDVAFFSFPRTTQEDATQRLLNYCSTLSPEVICTPHAKPTPYNPGYIQSGTTPEILKVKEILKNHHQVQLPETLGVSVADENILFHQLGIPVISLAPVGGFSHREGEWVSAKSLETVADWYITLLEHF